MTFDWSEYLELAQELAGDAASSPNKDAKLRSAISRAYYAAFCKARNHLRDIDRDQKLLANPPKVKNVHKYVRNQFEHSSDRSRKKIGTDLNRLRLRRNDADYKDVVSGLSQLSTVSLKTTHDIISALNTL